MVFLQIISQLSTWMITEVQKLIRIAKKITQEGKNEEKENERNYSYPESKR